MNLINMSNLESQICIENVFPITYLSLFLHKIFNVLCFVMFVGIGLSYFLSIQNLSLCHPNKYATFVLRYDMMKVPKIKKSSIYA